jgi:hypothetical protein
MNLRKYRVSRMWVGTCVTLLMVGFSGLASLGQQAPASPRKMPEATVAGKKVSLDYGAPSVRGRQIFGGVVPFEKVWRFGANKATHLTTEGDLMIGSLAVPAGTYSLYAWPTSGGMTLIVNKQTGQWGTVYDAAQDLGRVEMKVTKPSSPVEQMELSIDGGMLTFQWESVKATVPVKSR